MVERSGFAHDRQALSTPAENRLLLQLQLVVDWLRLAEQRHHWFILLGSAGLAVMLSLVSSTRDENPRYGMGLAAAIMIAGLMTGVVSFYPTSRIALRIAGKPHAPAADNNLYDFQHLARYDADLLVRSIKLWYLDELPADVTVSRGEHDLATEVVVNARIACTKMRLFSLGLALFAIGSLVALVSAIAALVA